MITGLMEWWTGFGEVEKLFLATGLISNVLFVAYLLLQLLGGHDTDLHGHEVDTGFTLLSLRSILAFGMFLGWTGLLVLRNGGSWWLALLAGIVAGLLAAWLALRLLIFLLHQQSDGTLDLHNALGQTADVHLVIPAAQAGPGKIMLEVQGALRELNAVTLGEALPTGRPVVVTGLTEEGWVVVEGIEKEKI